MPCLEEYGTLHFPEAVRQAESPAFRCFCCTVAAGRLPGHRKRPLLLTLTFRPPNMNSAALLRHAALIEGASLLILVFIAMPLKYFAGQPMAVKITGMIHGILFLLFCTALAAVHFRFRWPVGRSGLVFLSSFVPFGPFLLDRKMRQWSRNPGTRGPD